MTKYLFWLFCVLDPFWVKKQRSQWYESSEAGSPFCHFAWSLEWHSTVCLKLLASPEGISQADNGRNVNYVHTKKIQEILNYSETFGGTSPLAPSVHHCKANHLRQTTSANQPWRALKYCGWSHQATAEQSTRQLAKLSLMRCDATTKLWSLWNLGAYCLAQVKDVARSGKWKIVLGTWDWHWRVCLALRLHSWCVAWCKKLIVLTARLQSSATMHQISIKIKSKVKLICSKKSSNTSRLAGSQ